MNYCTDLSGFRASELQLKAMCGQTRFPSLYTWIDPLQVIILGHLLQYECQMRQKPFVYRLFLSDYV